MWQNKIVVAEDDDSIAHMVNMALGDCGYLCLRAHDGPEAISMVRMHTPDLLVLDVMLPRMDGMEVARQLKSDVLLSRTPILMLTALASVDNKVAGFEAGADDYLAKPFDLRELNARVQALIRTARREADRNPTTMLPGVGAIEAQIAATLSGAAATIVYFSLRSFDKVMESIGYRKAEAAIGQLGTLILDSSRSVLDAPFVGHLGGADFVVISAEKDAEKLADSVIENFAMRRGEWFPDIASGAETSIDMLVGLIDTRGVAAADSGIVTQRMNDAIRQARKSAGANWKRWTPDT